MYYLQTLMLSTTLNFFDYNQRYKLKNQHFNVVQKIF